MKTRLFLLATLFALAAGAAQAALTLTAESDHALTPNETDSIGVFSRWFFHPGRDRFYALYAGRPANSGLPPGTMTHLAWREYGPGFVFTGRSGSLVGPPAAGDFAIAQIDSGYYVISVQGWDYRLSSFDDDFAPVANTILPLDVHDSNTDQMMGAGNGRLLIGSLHEPTATHPRFPMQPAWTPTAHLFQYDTALNPVEPNRYLSPTFYAWGASATFNPANQHYVVVSMDSFPAYQLVAYEYDTNWMQVGQHLLSTDGQWSQGLVWDGAHYFVAWHSGHEHRCGNIEVAAFDIDWNLEAKVRITNNSTFPPPLGPGRNANRPFITKVGDSLYVSYDLGGYDYRGGTAVIENRDWQAHVAVVRIGTGATGVAGSSSATVLRVFPSPSRASFRYALGHASGAPYDIEVVDLAGRLVERRRSAAAEGVLDLSRHEAGVYFVRVRGDGGGVSRRVVKLD